MKLIHQRNLIFVSTKGAQPVVNWPGVALGYLAFVGATAAAGTMGWFLLSLATGADFIQGIAAVVAISFGSAGAALAAVVSGALRRTPSEMPPLD